MIRDSVKFAASKENGVAADSQVPKRMRPLRLRSWIRGDGRRLPFFVRAGKCSPNTVTEVRVELKPAPSVVFPEIGQRTQATISVFASVRR